MAVRILMAALLAGSMSLFPHSSTMADEKKPLVVFVTGDHEYGSEETLPILARELERRYGLRTKVLRDRRPGSIISTDGCNDRKEVALLKRGPRRSVRVESSHPGGCV